MLHSILSKCCLRFVLTLYNSTFESMLPVWSGINCSSPLFWMRMDSSRSGSLLGGPCIRRLPIKERMFPDQHARGWALIISQSWYVKTTMMCSRSCLVQSPPCETGKWWGKDCVPADKDREERNGNFQDWRECRPCSDTWGKWYFYILPQSLKGLCGHPVQFGFFSVNGPSVLSLLPHLFVSGRPEPLGPWMCASPHLTFIWWIAIKAETW